MSTTRVSPTDALANLEIRHAKSIVTDPGAKAALERCLDVLVHEAQNLEALNAVGLILLGTGDFRAARLWFNRAVTASPGSAVSHAHAAYTHLLENDLASAKHLYETAARIEPNLAIAYQGLAEIHERSGDAESAALYRKQSLQLRPVIELPYTGAGAPIRVLALGSDGDANVQVTRVLDQSLFAVTAIAVTFFDPATPLPPHDIIFNAIGEADAARSTLKKAQRLVEQSRRPVLNAPQRILQTDRVSIAESLQSLSPFVIVPLVRCVERSALLAPNAAGVVREMGFAWPILVRVPGLHGGKACERIESAEALYAVVSSMATEHVYIIQYVDTKAPDGAFRKYRVLCIDGALIPSHLAVSTDWKVHYFSAQTQASEPFRHEETAFLDSMPALLGPQAMHLIGTIAQTLGLDYGGIDFGITPDGKLVVFEANATMNFRDITDPTDYRSPSVARTKAIITGMVLRKALSSSP